MSDRYTFIRGNRQKLRGHAWAVPCFGGFAGVLWFTQDGTMPIPVGCEVVLGKATFRTRGEARAARAHVTRADGLESPVKVRVRLERAK